jgi:hypothetical protein
MLHVYQNKQSKREAELAIGTGLYGAHIHDTPSSARASEDFA